MGDRISCLKLFFWDPHEKLQKMIEMQYITIIANLSSAASSVLFRMTFKAPERRVELAWAGGAVLSTLSLFKGMCTTKEEFLEYGAQVYYKKRAQDGVTEALV